MKFNFCKLASVIFFISLINSLNAQTSKPTNLPLTNADPGTFPYLKSLPNIYPRNQSDSVTLEQNKVYVYDGKQYLVIEGKTSKQTLSIRDSKKSNYSVSQLISEYAKVISTLGGKKVFEGQLPKPALKTIAGTDDIVTLASNGQLPNGAYQGVVVYAIKTPEKEIWVQLQPHTIVSEYYALLIVEKENKLISGNINKENKILKELEKSSFISVSFAFEPDKDILLSESKDELLNLIAVLQIHPEWKVQIDVHAAPVGDPSYILQLTEKRALAIKRELNQLGVKEVSVVAKGWGDQKPLEPNNTEAARIKNNRVEIRKI